MLIKDVDGIRCNDEFKLNAQTYWNGIRSDIEGIYYPHTAFVRSISF